MEVIDNIKASRDEIRQKLNTNFSYNIPATAHLSQFSEYVKGETPSEWTDHTVLSNAVYSVSLSKYALILALNQTLSLEIPTDAKLSEISEYLNEPLRITVSSTSLNFASDGGNKTIEINTFPSPLAWKII